MEQTRVGIIGATGYSGRELIKLLSRHNKIKLTLLSSRTEMGIPVKNYFPFLDKNLSQLIFSNIDINEIREKCDLVFFATPSGTAKDLAPLLYKQGLKVIDISGDFRLSTVEDYQKWYKYDHPHPDLLNEVVYCIPEINRNEAKNSPFISNPGCYPTSILLPLVPVIQSLKFQGTVLIDAKSGVTGAGKKVAMDYIYTEMNENFYPYKLAGTHQHIPEIEKYLKEWTDLDLKISFNPHLLPLDRGILSTIYLQEVAKPNYQKAVEAVTKKYQEEPFVRVFEKQFPKIKDVSGTNQCHIGFAYDERAQIMVIVSAIDNLLKGASGQAVQNMNLMLGIDEKEGLC